MIKMDSNPSLPIVFGISKFPSVVYLPEDHPISSVDCVFILLIQFSVEERAKYILYKENTVIVDSHIRHLIESITNIQVLFILSSLCRLLNNNPLFFLFLLFWNSVPSALLGHPFYRNSFNFAFLCKYNYPIHYIKKEYVNKGFLFNLIILIIVSHF